MEREGKPGFGGKSWRCSIMLWLCPLVFRWAGATIRSFPVHDQLHPARLSARLVSTVCQDESLPYELSSIGKVRLAKWFTTMAPKVKAKIVKDVTQLVLARRTRMCNFLEYKGIVLLAHAARARFDATGDGQTARLCTEDTHLYSSCVGLDRRTMSWSLWRLSIDTWKC